MEEKLIKDQYLTILSLNRNIIIYLIEFLENKELRIIDKSKNKRLFLILLDTNLKYNNLSCIQTLKGLNGHENYVISIIQLNDGRIASGSSDKTIKFWD